MRAAALLTLALAVASCASAPPAQSAAAPASAPAAPNVIEVTDAMGSPHAGEAAPDFSLADGSGAVTTLSSLKGNVVVLSFVASWCPYSKAEQPNLAVLPAAYANKPVKFVVVDVNEDEAGYQKYVTRHAMQQPVVRDVDGKVAESFTAPGAQPKIKKRAEVPIAGNVIIDEQGVIRGIYLADLAHYDAELTHTRALVDQLLAQRSATAQ